MLENVESTINNICEWINKELKNTSTQDGGSVLPDMIASLAKLIAAKNEFFR